jgi:hypothetical protein
VHSFLLGVYCYSLFIFTPDSRLHIYNVHVEDKYLGWKPKANSIGKHVYSSNFDVEYIMDENGYKKIGNTENPDHSIYFFGDSFTFGQGVSNGDTFPNIIKDRYVTEKINIYMVSWVWNCPDVSEVLTGKTV